MCAGSAAEPLAELNIASSHGERNIVKYLFYLLSVSNYNFMFSFHVKLIQICCISKIKQIGNVKEF